MTVDEWVGTRPIDVEQGLAILAVECRQRDGRLLGPVLEPPIRTLGRR